MNRRGFLTGLLSAPAVITTPGLLMPVRAWADIPVFIGDGIYDDTAAVQAAIDGLPFDAPNGNLSRMGNVLQFGRSVIRVTDTIQLSGDNFAIDGGRWDASALTDRAVFGFQNLGDFVAFSNVDVRYSYGLASYPNTPSVSATAFRSYSVDECP